MFMILFLVWDAVLVTWFCFLADESGDFCGRDAALCFMSHTKPEIITVGVIGAIILIVLRKKYQ